MFTGLVKERGRVLKTPEPSPGGGVLLDLGHGAELAAGLALGASLAVSGVCLTVIAQEEPGDGGDGGAGGDAGEGGDDGIVAVSRVEMGQETLARTTLGELVRGSEVNLEPSLRAGDPMGGHWVQGHVDTTIELLERDEREDHAVLTFALPPQLAAYVVEKGSVALDGVSLTVAGLGEDRFSVWLIPHTLQVTTLGALVPGRRVNLEVDILAKYVERAVAVHAPR